MKIIRYLSILLLAIVSVSCGDSETYTLDVTIDGLGTRNVNLFIYSRSGLKSVSIPAVDNVLTYKSSSGEPVLVDLLTNDRRFLGCIMVGNGETVKAHFVPDNNGSTSVDGNKVSHRLYSFISDNAAYIDSAQPDKLNAAIEQYVKGNPDDIVSGILLSRFYDVVDDYSRPAELAALLSPEARPAAVMGGFSELINVNTDSLPPLTEISLMTSDKGLQTFSPGDGLGLMLVVSGADSEGRDSVVNRLNETFDTLKEQVRMVELVLAADTVRLNKLLTDSVKPKYDVAWMPGGVVSPSIRSLNIKQIPMYILADTVGAIIYRGTLLEDAVGRCTSSKETD